MTRIAFHLPPRKRNRRRRKSAILRAASSRPSAFRDVAHELFGDGIRSAIDMSVDIRKVEDPPGMPRMALTLNGRWLRNYPIAPCRGC